MKRSSLGATNAPVELVPGDPAAIGELALVLRDLGDSLGQAAGSLAQLNTQAGWRGQASEAFRSRFGDEPPRWSDAGRGFHDAADALDRYASAVVRAHEQARIAIQQWQQGQTLTVQARDELDDAQAPGGGAPMTMGELIANDPGQAHRDEAGRILEEARRGLASAGDDASVLVRRACAKAPEQPGFWSKLSDAVGNGLYDVAAGTVNGLASYGNALIHHPEDLGAMLLGTGLMGVSAGGEVLGIGLDSTGAGSVVGVPLNVASTAGLVTGGTLTAGGALDLGQHAVGDNRVELMENRAGGSPGGSTGGAGTAGGAGARTVDEALRELPRGRSKYVHLVDSDARLRAKFDELIEGGTEVTEHSYPGRVYELEDGSRIALREESKSGGATIDVRTPGRPPRRVHIEEPRS